LGSLDQIVCRQSWLCRNRAFPGRDNPLLSAPGAF
jgi:hypothetical protein